MKIKNLLKSSFIMVVVGATIVLNGCKKEQIAKEEDGTGVNISEVEPNAVPFFEVEKGDSISKGIYREKPDFTGSEEATILFDTETGTGLKAAGDGYNQYGYPLVDMVISSKRSSGVPSGYIPVDLNEGAGGNWIYLSCRFSDFGKGINYLSVELNSSPKGVQFDNQYANYATAESLPADCNDGAGGKYIYIKQQYNTSTKYIRQIRIVSATSSNITQTGWIKVPQDLNAGAGGKYIYIFYKAE